MRRFLLDLALADSTRQFALSDFLDGLDVPSADNKIAIAVEIMGFEGDLDVLTVRTDTQAADIG